MDIIFKAAISAFYSVTSTSPLAADSPSAAQDENLTSREARRLQRAETARSPDAVTEMTTEAAKGAEASAKISEATARPSAQQVLEESAAALAAGDVLLLGIHWNGSIPSAKQEQALQGLKQIHTEPLDPTNTIAASREELSKRVDENEELLEGLAPSRSKTAQKVNLDHARSQLDAEKLLNNERIRECLGILFKALIEQLNCCDLNHFASLHLTGFKNQLDEHSRLFFDLYLSSRFDHTPCHWHESRCMVGKAIQQLEEELPASGCETILRCEEDKKQLQILLEEAPTGRLQLRRDRSDRLISDTAPNVTLYYLLERKYFIKPTRRGSRLNRNYFLPLDRAKLNLNLALSLLHLSQDEWRQVTWDSESIYFLKDPSTGDLLDKQQPYLAWALKPTDTGAECEIDEEGKPTCDLRLLHFARLIIEIYSGIQFTSMAEGRVLQLELEDEISDTGEYLLGRDDMIVAAVKACLSTEGKLAAEDTADPGKIRRFIYSNIVQTLSSLVAGNDNPLHVQNLSLINRSAAARASGKSLSPYDGKRYDRPENETAARNSKVFFKRMDEWVANYIKPLEKIQISSLKPHLRNKIKIAVIDSGVQWDDGRIKAARSGKHKRIVKGRNFLPNALPDDWDDPTGVGHGTIVTTLLLDIAPHAEIYVAKVTDQLKIPSNHLYCIGNAIYWAIQKWEVDIITMSIVLTDENEYIEERLRQAIDPSYEGERVSQKIIFAAAGNNGANDPLAWPAKRKGVIAINASDGLGAASNINPVGSSEENFATLGCDIVTEWTPQGTMEEKNIYVSGTSFATPIAAGIAANILEFARHKMKLTTDQKKRLYSSKCMESIFKQMTGHKAGFDYIQPWTMWNQHAKLAMQKDICDALLDAISY